MSTRRRRWPLVVAVVIGLALALAPAAWQMFDRAPKGGHMIGGFRPYMSEATIAGFRGDLAVIDAAHGQVAALRADGHAAAVVGQPAVAAFDRGWPGIDDDMGSMLTTMHENIGHYRGVAALPPFVLFPWFFVLPGLLVAAVGLWLLLADRRGDVAPRARTVRRRVLIALGIGLVAAPAVFQMFTRAPGGARMIDAFRPFMTQAKVTQVQGYFLTIGDAEGALRLSVLPKLRSGGGVAPQQVAAIERLDAQWPAISARMAPMIGAMTDNVGNYQAVAALPPFWLFPWFFVVPGVAVAICGRLAGGKA